ncbi:myeloid cell surface antigen CD33-like [Clinocottus analis]|uniref:myeloid cell surface antigen CD33-like n=1 Tax=Clinocottus analis TaxID=304258 RepID=UPI0035C0D4CB
MAVLDPKASWCFMFLLAAAGSQQVNYPGPVCAVRGSSVTLLCTFTPAVTNGEEVQITRVIWCQDNSLCFSYTPSVYDSEEKNNLNNPRYRYLGDKKGNCSLQITDVQKEDNATLHFRMEGNMPRASFVGEPGVRVRVVDVTQMEIRSSREGTFKRGEAVTLTCNTTCSFHQLEVTWFRDCHALTFTGPALHLGSLSAGDSGNYTCGLKNNIVTRSTPHSVLVEEEEDEGSKRLDSLLVVPLVLFSLLTLLIIIVASMVIHKTCEDKKEN